MSDVRYFGTLEGLKDKLASLSMPGKWAELNDNHVQFRHESGGIMNWFPPTGTISFQGKKKPKNELEKQVRKIFFPHEDAEEALGEVQIETVEEFDFHFSSDRFSESELVIGLVGGVGTRLDRVIDILEDKFRILNYEVEVISISGKVIPELIDTSNVNLDSEYERIDKLMTAGNEARKIANDNSVLALGAAAYINSLRSRDESGHYSYCSRKVYIVKSLKHNEEVLRLRDLYPEAFYLIGVFADRKRKIKYLHEEKGIDEDDADKLIDRDECEDLPYGQTCGQKTSDTFHMSDCFIHEDENIDKLKYSICRFCDIIFGNPYVTPTFDEYAMFMAYSSSLRSADLSRQVGAVVAKNRMIISTGANDCPKYGGGQYWPMLDQDYKVVDKNDGRDYMRGYDPNKVEKIKIYKDIESKIAKVTSDVDKVMNVISKSKINDITEYGRVVHAEMEALISCARIGVSIVGATLYCTTFPCHNCAKHIVSSGISRVVYVEPYPKSKASELHSDSIYLGFEDSNDVVNFEPFVGVGPRRFFDLFSIRLGAGYTLKRKDSDGNVLPWEEGAAKLRIQMVPLSYIEKEIEATSHFKKHKEASKSV